MTERRNYADPSGTGTGGNHYNPRFSQTYAYDQIGSGDAAFQLVVAQKLEPNATTAPASLAKTTYSADRLGRTRSIVDQDQAGTAHQIASKTATFDYDEAGRLLQVHRTYAGNGSFEFDTTYQYDSIGQLRSLPVGRSELSAVLQSLEVSESTLERWLLQYGGMKSEEA